MTKKPTDMNLEDQALFQQAMKGIRPLKINPRISPVTEKKKPLKPLHHKMPAEPIIDNLSDTERLTPVTSTDYLQYKCDGLQPRTFRKLRQGQFPLEETLDLHGLTSEQARHALLKFINHCQQQQLTHVIVIHGKGRGVNDSHPILKNKVHHWLQQIPQVLAYCSARPQHGGLGAVYVLLKK